MTAPLEQRIAEALEGVTPGPWTLVRDGNDEEWLVRYPDGEDASLLIERDGAFIAAARTLLPECANELAALREQLRVAREALEAIAASDYFEAHAETAKHALAALAEAVLERAKRVRRRRERQERAAGGGVLACNNYDGTTTTLATCTQEEAVEALTKGGLEGVSKLLSGRKP